MAGNKEALEQLQQSLHELYASGFTISDLHAVVDSVIDEHEIQLPVSIFKKELGALESIILYLKDGRKLSYKEMSVLLARSPVTVGNAYRTARRKFSGKLSVDSSLTVPVSLFANRTEGVQRLLVRYLHDHTHLTYSEIARLLKRDPRTIWTAYHGGVAK